MSFKKSAMPYVRGSAHFKPEFSIEQHGGAGPLDVPVLLGLAVGHVFFHALARQRAADCKDSRNPCNLLFWSPCNLLICLRSRSEVHLSRSTPGGDRKEGGRGPLLSLSLSAADSAPIK